MSPEAYSAAFAGAGVLLTAVLFWVSRRKTQETERANKLEEVQQEAEEHTNEKLGQLAEKLDDMDARYTKSLETLDGRVYGLAQDVAEVKMTVAVHSDRFERPSYLTAVGGRRT